MKKRIAASLFVCQITDTHLKVVSCAAAGVPRKILACVCEPISQDADLRIISGLLVKTLLGLGYKSNAAIVFCVPRSKAACRYIRVPAQAADEIEKIVILQSPRFLPYPAEKLVSGYEVVAIGKDGYSDINLVIVHKDLIERYFAVCGTLNPRRISVALSSYGLGNIFNDRYPSDKELTMGLNIDARQAEVVVLREQKVVFSRAFTCNISILQWEAELAEQIHKSMEAFAKEVGNGRIGCLKILSQKALSEGSWEVLKARLGISVEQIAFSEKDQRFGMVADYLAASECSFFDLIGSALVNVKESVNLLPKEAKDLLRQKCIRTEQVKFWLLVLGTIAFFLLGAYKYLDNKAIYLSRLKGHLQNLSKDAKAYEEIEDRFARLIQRSENTPKTVDIISELHTLAAQGISLISITYEEGRQLIMHGESAQLQTVFELVGRLEKSPVFANFRSKVRYASKKNTPSGELVDFEILLSAKDKP